MPELCYSTKKKFFEFTLTSCTCANNVHVETMYLINKDIYIYMKF